MINIIKSSADFGDQPDRRPPRPYVEAEAAQAPGAQAVLAPQSDIRLLIEQDANGGGFIYKLVNRATGEVISELSRDELIRMSADPKYTAGKVVDTKA
jgi:hypothetical protein